MSSTLLRLLLATILLALCRTLPINQKIRIAHPYANPDENRGNNEQFFEGDIVIEKERLAELYGEQIRPLQARRHIRSSTISSILLSRKKRNAEYYSYDLWYTRIIPYAFDNIFHVYPERMKLVEAAMVVLSNMTCLRFVKRTTERDYIFFRSTNSCNSKIGRMGGLQEIGMGYECLRPQGVILHEILHAAGLFHEQSRADRDSFVDVLWDNIVKEHFSNFEIRRNTEKDDVLLSLPYDYGSVMHYSNTTFITDHAARNHGITLRPKQDLPNGVVMGQREELSSLDQKKINTFYRCDIQACDALQDIPDHGNLLQSGTEVGATVAYVCDEGFTLIGAMYRVCRYDGTWSGEMPLCLDTRHSDSFHYCTFENSTEPLCGWRQSTSDDLDWILNSKKTKSQDTGPFCDHTIGDLLGTYLYMEASERSFGDRARLISPTFDLGKAKPCLVFYLYMYGMNMGNLSIYFSDKTSVHPVDSQLYTFVGEQGEEWKQVFIELDQASGPFVVKLEATRGDGFRSDIAVDDLIVGECATLAPLTKSNPIQEAVECSFDWDLCHFLQSSNDQFNWTLREGQTPTLYTGPDCDPLDCDNGQYLYIETSSPRRYGDKARIETPYIGGSGQRCLSFYYHMYGDSVGMLKVKQRSLLTGLEMILWEASGNHGNSWHQHHITFSALNSYKLIFEGYVGAMGSLYFRGDIAIDEIRLDLGQCSGALWFDCDFEGDVCGWRNSSVPNQTFPVYWRRHQGGTDTPLTGPTSDRNDPDGYYLYVESSRTITGDLARIESPTMEVSTTGYCVEFYYHMYGQMSGNLTMFLEPEGGTRQQLWKIQGDQGNRWRFQHVDLSSAQSAQKFKILFEASLSGSTGDVALDNLKITHSICGS